MGYFQVRPPLFRVVTQPKKPLTNVSGMANMLKEVIVLWQGLVIGEGRLA